MSKENYDSGKVSIVLPTYNGAGYLSQAISSCLAQAHERIELIIVDDGSLDPQIPLIVKSYADQRIRYLKHRENRGLAAALNTGFACARGEYLTWTSDDNYYSGRAIECMVGYLKAHPRVDFVYTNYYLVGDNGSIIREIKVSPPGKLDEGNYIGPCFLYRRKIYEVLGGYNPEFFLAEDYEYWLRVRKKFKMEKLNHCLYFYCQHENSLTAHFSGTWKIAEATEKAMRSHIPACKYYYWKGKILLSDNNFHDAREFLFKAVSVNPLYFRPWYLLALLLAKFIAKNL